MRRPIVLAALAAITATSALAADYRPGPYAGATMGLSTGYLTNNAGDLTTDGVPISGIVGYTFALPGNLVIGGELEATWANVKGTQAAGAFTLEASTDYALALKARLGYAAGPTLLYATAGPSWSKSKIEAIGLKDDHLTLNVLAGAGVDLQITNTVALRLEAVRQFSADAQTWTLGPAATKLDAGETTIKLGVVINLN